MATNQYNPDTVSTPWETYEETFRLNRASAFDELRLAEQVGGVHRFHCLLGRHVNPADYLYKAQYPQIEKAARIAAEVLHTTTEAQVSMIPFWTNLIGNFWNHHRLKHGGMRLMSLPSSRLPNGHDD